ncbi:MAG: transcription elongation factor GreA [Anaerolineae bacterium]|nr:transcription elongation factor GreA [Anaerolineae bacterium]MDQ7033828.1 transcription elongation factor GreA [Anaerolineae bacterium]
MIDETQYLTQEGMDSLEKRLNYLTKVRRAEIAERLRQALEDGGELTENTEYEDAKNEQAFIEGEIVRIDYVLRHAKLIENTGDTDEVYIGSLVKVVEKGADDIEEYRLVGPAEANPREGKISTESPLGKALIGAKVGDKVKIQAPDGDITFIIQDISF